MGTHGVVLDTNVYVSGLGWSGPPDECVELVLSGAVAGYTSEELLSELQRVLEYDRLPFTPAEIETYYGAVRDGTEIVEPTEEHDAAIDDPDDNKVIDCAVAADAEYIITGNVDHFPDSYRGIDIVTPGEYIRECR